MRSADITGGTYFALAWAAGSIGVLAWMYRPRLGGVARSTPR
ncbi:MAG TPA: hypothetical protein VMM14_08520 [Acidimicrobiia bacterium]|nr:hypothetical protein [Acidimicrobiia bacterium]